MRLCCSVIGGDRKQVTTSESGQKHPTMNRRGVSIPRVLKPTTLISTLTTDRFQPQTPNHLKALIHQSGTRQRPHRHPPKSPKHSASNHAYLTPVRSHYLTRTCQPQSDKQHISRNAKGLSRSPSSAYLQGDPPRLSPKRTFKLP